MTITTNEYIISNNSQEVAAYIYNKLFITNLPKKRKKVILLEKRTDEEVLAISKDYMGTKVDIQA